MQLASLDQMDHLASLDLKEQLVSRVPPDSQDHLVPLGSLEQQERLDSLVSQDPQDQQGLLASLEHQVTKTLDFMSKIENPSKQFLCIKSI